MATAPVIGIDLGTTNTVVAVVKDGQASAIPDESGNVLMPSVVSFHPSGNVLVGRAAKERRLVDSINTIYSVKRLIGRSWDSEEVRKARSRFPFQMKEGPGQAALVVARGESYTLPEISAFVLRKAKSIAENFLGTTVDRAVITVPANFNDLQRAATKVAGRVAGLEVMRILNEPTAAALAYGYGKSSSERIAVYDFGGGTFDVTLLDLSDNVFEVLATAGNTFLGGDDIDLAIAERMAETFLSRHRYDPRSEPQIYEHLKVAAEDVKHRLSTENEVTIEIKDIAHGAGGKALGLSFSMTRGELERLATPFIDRTFEVCKEALGIARLAQKDFQQLLLVGGSTRVPLVKRRVEEFWKREVRSHISPDEVVAIGAAIQASALSGAEARRKGTVPPPPNPARPGMPSASDRPSVLAKRRGGTLPPGVQRSKSDTAPGPIMQSGQPRPRMDTQPDAFGIPSTQPFQGGRQRMPTTPGVQEGADPTAPTRHPAGLGVIGRASQIPEAERPKQKTGTGLGPAAQRAVSGPTLVSAGEAAKSAKAIAESELPLVMPEPPPPPKPKEESVAFQLGDGDIEDLSVPPPQEQKTTGVRPLAQPMAFSQPAELAETDLEVPEIPEDEPTKVGTPSPAELERARQEGLAMLREQQEQQRREQEAEQARAAARREQEAEQARAAARRAAAPPPPALFTATAPLQNFGTLQLDAPVAPARAPAAPPVGSTTAPLQAVGVTTQKLASSHPPPMMAYVPPVLVDVTPLTLAVETVEGFCDSIIARNTTVPCSRTREFVTAADNQTSVRVRVAQGESKKFGENTLLGEVELSGLRPARRGDVRIAVSFALDASGMLVVSAKDVGTGRETSTQVHLVGLPDAQEVARMAARQAARGM
ncbi:MAG TPA: Hsp70 family protein [Polyangiaceae bacterium]|nr:Hsp70 family protein [Polyangiaceae bacterium]